MASPLDKKLHVIVIGGSLAGLFNAIALGQLGHRVTTLEQSSLSLLRDQGAGIVVGKETLQWVQKCGRSRRNAEHNGVFSQQGISLTESVANNG